MTLKVSLSPKMVSADALFVFVPEKKWTPASKKPFGNALSKNLFEEISARFSAEDFEGKKGQILQLFPGEKGFKKVFLVGLGNEKKLKETRKAAMVSMQIARKSKAKSVAFLLPDFQDLRQTVSGAIFENYEFKHGDKSKHFFVSSLILITSKKWNTKELEAEVVASECVNFTRELVNMPSNLMTPQTLANEARKIGKNSSIKVTVLGSKEMMKLGMGALMAVAQGAVIDPQLIVLEYRGGTSKSAPVALVGKGVCFDSGGYNLKPVNYIETMHTDMAGAATVLGIFKWLAQIKPRQNVVGVIGAVENLVSGNAYKPGDIITAMNGQTIHITNSDAEGRLVLADCLYYAATKFKPSKILDFATLTGAAIAALGHDITALETNNQKFLSEVKNAAQQADEMTWELPVTDFFREKVKGDISDLQNWTAGMSAGSSMGAAFLENFVEKTPWVHADIAGTAFQSEKTELGTKGATGVMLRTACELLK